AALDALKDGCGGTLGGGTHHAFRSEGSGFCVFNDIAVAIEFLRKNGLVRRAAVIDLDVHQGDGTADIFHLDPDVFTLSIHCQNVPIVVTSGGGYSQPIELSAEAHANTYRTAWQVFGQD